MSLFLVLNELSLVRQYFPIFNHLNTVVLDIIYITPQVHLATIGSRTCDQSFSEVNMMNIHVGTGLVHLACAWSLEKLPKIMEN